MSYTISWLYAFCATCNIVITKILIEISIIFQTSRSRHHVVNTVTSMRYDVCVTSRSISSHAMRSMVSIVVCLQLEETIVLFLLRSQASWFWLWLYWRFCIEAWNNDCYRSFHDVRYRFKNSWRRNQFKRRLTTQSCTAVRFHRRTGRFGFCQKFFMLCEECMTSSSATLILWQSMWFRLQPGFCIFLAVCSKCYKTYLVTENTCPSMNGNINPKSIVSIACELMKMIIT